MVFNIFKRYCFSVNMAKVKLVIFDLDGTLNNSAQTIKYCFRRTGEYYGKYDISEERLDTGLTGPFDVNISKVLGLKPEQVGEAIRKYSVHFEETSPVMSKLFPGSTETILYLKEHGCKIGLATMMVETYAVAILRNYGILDLFDSVHGTTEDFRYGKEDLIRFCLIDTGLNAEDAIMVGDGLDDHRAAKVARTRFVAALYGFGLDKEYCIENDIPGISDVSELKDLINQLS